MLCAYKPATVLTVECYELKSNSIILGQLNGLHGNSPWKTLLYHSGVDTALAK